MRLKPEACACSCACSCACACACACEIGIRVYRMLTYEAVSDWMPARVHALNIIAMTLDEAEALVAHPAGSI